MNFKTTLFLIALLIIAGVTFYFVRQQPPPSNEPPTPKNLLTISQDEVAKVSVKPADGQPYTLEHTGTDWTITAPIHAKADTFSAGDLVRELCSLQSHAQVGTDIATGVDHPATTVTLTDRDGKTQTLSFGEKSDVGDNLYVRVDDNSKVDVVGSDVQTYLDKSVNDYRDMNLVTATADKIDRLEIQTPKQTLALSRVDGKWQITSPAKYPAEQSQMDDLLSAVTSLRAGSFVDSPQPASTYQFNKPQLAITCWTTPASTQPTSQPAGKKIIFGRYENLLKQNVFAEADGAVIKVPASTMDSLNKSPLDLRDRTVLDIDPAKVTELEIRRHLPAATQPTSRPASGIDLVIDRNAKPQAATSPSTHPTTVAATQPSPTWVFVTKEKTGAKVNEDNVTDVLTALHPLKAEKYLEKLPSTMPSDQFRVTVTASGEKYTIYLSATPANDTNAIATYNGSIFEVPNTLIDHLKLDFGWPSK